MKQKKNFRASNLWPDVSLLATLNFISPPKNTKLIYIKIVKLHIVLMYTILA
jgi:hypothetical protein